MADVVTIVNGRTYALGDIANVSDLTWSHGWPYGCLEASWTMDLPPDVYPAALQPRQDNDVWVEVWDGPVRVWCGYLIEPDPGETWELHAVGWYAAFANLLCLTADASTTSAVPNVVVPAAITRAGLPVTIGSTLAATSIAEADETVAANTVMALLDTYSAQIGKRWWVDADYVLRIDDDPTTPTLVLDNDDPLRGVADDDYVTDVYPRYVTTLDPDGNPAAYGLGHVSAASRPAGRRERSMDLTDLGVLPSGVTDANTYAQSQLDLNGSRMSDTRGLTVRYGDLTRLGGSPRRLGLIRGGDMFRSFNVADASGQVQLGLTRDVVIGKWTYRDGETTAQLEPVGLATRTFMDTFRRLNKVASAAESGRTGQSLTWDGHKT